MLPALPTLHTARLALSPFTPADAPLVQRLAGDARIAATTAFIPHPYPDGAAEKWIAGHLLEFLELANLTLAIRPRDGAGALFGAINLKLSATTRGRVGELGYWVAVPFWNRGYCTEAARRMIRHGFAELGLDEIRAHHFVENAASGRVMEKCGMRREGVLPRSVLKNGVLKDTVRYSIGKENFLNSNPLPLPCASP